MNFASNYTYLAKAKPKVFKPNQDNLSQDLPVCEEEEDLNLNVFVVTFEGVPQAEKQLAGGDPYNCSGCKAVLNKHSKVLWEQNLAKSDLKMKIELSKAQALWQCEFCGHSNIFKIEKEEIPAKDDVVYMVESEHMGVKSENDSTIVFCIDTSGSMNSTTAVEGIVDLKFGMSQEQIEMLKQFMEPGDEAQLNFLPGAQNQNKTFVSRKQCILSAIESQIGEIKKAYPYKKIGFVTFSNEVVALGDTKNETVHILGDKLSHKQGIIDSLTNFNLTDPIIESEKTLLNNINKIEAKGATALGPALVTALQIAEKGSPGSSLILCTDGLANIGIGQLDPYTEEKKHFYAELGEQAKSKNVTVNIISIKGEGCKVEAIGQLAQKTNGNIKIVNPEKLSEDFANVLKDQVVGLNVAVKVLLHKSMNFRNEDPNNIKEGGCILEKEIANATKNTRVSFEYDVRSDQDLQKLKIDLKELKKVPFQAQIEYTSPIGGRFLRVVSAICDTTESKVQMAKEANLGVVHHRVTNQTAALYKQGDYKESQKFNNKWANFLGNIFKDKKYSAHQNKFMEKNQRLNKAIRHKHKKSIQKKQQKKEELEQHELELMNRYSDVSSDEDQRELVDNLMERQAYSLKKSSRRERSLTPNSRSGSFINISRSRDSKASVEIKKQVKRSPSVKKVEKEVKPRANRINKSQERVSGGSSSSSSEYSASPVMLERSATPIRVERKKNIKKANISPVRRQVSPMLNPIQREASPMIVSRQRIVSPVAPRQRQASVESDASIASVKKESVDKKSKRRASVKREKNRKR